MDKTIFREFSQQGRQVLVFGPTGAGKTSMVLDNLGKLKDKYKTESIRVTMTNKTTTQSFIADVANELQLMHHIQDVEMNETSQKAEGGVAGWGWLSAKFSRQDKGSMQETSEQYSGIDDFAILEKALFERNTVLVVDDMENLTDNASDLRTRLAEIAKNMSDDAVNYEKSYAKIVFVGIARTAEQLWKDVQSLKSRLATISVPYLNSDESKMIIKTGWDKAKLASSEKQVKKTVFISSGIGKVVHELGQKTGYAAIDNHSRIIKDEYIDDAIQGIFEVNELEYESKMSKAKNKTSTKTTVRNYVLYVMANDDRMTMTVQDILKAVNEIRNNPQEKTNPISNALTQLKSSSLSIVENEGRNSWRFVDPMFKAYVREHKDELLLKKSE